MQAWRTTHSSSCIRCMRATVVETACGCAVLSRLEPGPVPPSPSRARQACGPRTRPCRWSKVASCPSLRMSGLVPADASRAWARDRTRRSVRPPPRGGFHGKAQPVGTRGAEADPRRPTLVDVYLGCSAWQRCQTATHRSKLLTSLPVGEQARKLAVSDWSWCVNPLREVGDARRPRADARAHARNGIPYPQHRHTRSG